MVLPELIVKVSSAPTARVPETVKSVEVAVIEAAVPSIVRLFRVFPPPLIVFEAPVIVSERPERFIFGTSVRFPERERVPVTVGVPEEPVKSRLFRVFPAPVRVFEAPFITRVPAALTVFEFVRSKLPETVQVPLPIVRFLVFAEPNVTSPETLTFGEFVAPVSSTPPVPVD
jgi:hypothetical protein